MKRSKILDKFISEKTRLDIKARSPERRSFSLDAVLLDYDRDGYLFRGKQYGRRAESSYYIPRIELIYFAYDNEKWSPDNTSSNEVSQGDERVEEQMYIFKDASYSPISKELQRSGQAMLFEGKKENYALNLLFNQKYRRKFIPLEKFIMDQSDNEPNKTQRQAVRAMMSRLRNKLKKFNLVIENFQGGYRLKDLDQVQISK